MLVFLTSAQRVGDLVTAAGKRRFVVFSSLAAAGELAGRSARPSPAAVLLGDGYIGQTYP